MRLRVLLGVIVLILLCGCGAERHARGASFAEAPSRRPAVAKPAVVPEQPDVSGPFGLELKADQAVGRLGSAVATMRQRLDAAMRARDVVQLSCVRDKLQMAETLERTAGEYRSALREAMLEDDEKATAEYRKLEALERDARSVVSDSGHCVGEQLMAAQVSAQSAPVSRNLGFSFRFGSGDAKRESAARVRARKAMVSETVLAGAADHDHGGLASMAHTAAATGGGTAAPRAPAQASARHDTSMLIRTASLTLAVYEVDKNIDAVEAAATQAGGYLAMRGDRQIVVRVPRDRFDDALRRIEKLGDVLHRNVSAEDVTDQYVDLEMRLRNAQAVRGRLEALLANATVHDAVEIQRELAKVTEEIERLEGKLKLLRDRIAWSTITVTFEKLQQQKVHQQALLPFPWMNVIGLSPLLSVPR